MKKGLNNKKKKVDIILIKEIQKIVRKYERQRDKKIGKNVDEFQIIKFFDISDFF